MAFNPEPDSTALIVVDVQNDYCHENGALAKLGKSVETTQSIVPNITALISCAKDVSVPVLFVVTHHDPVTDSPAWTSRQLYNKNQIICLTGSWGAESYMLDRKQADYIIIKNRYSGFYGTNLDLILRSLKRNKLLICGFTTNVCVESTVRDANSLDYFAAVVSDCTAASTEQEHASGLYNIEKYFGYLTNLTEIKRFWNI